MSWRTDVDQLQRPVGRVVSLDVLLWRPKPRRTAPPRRRSFSRATSCVAGSALGADVAPLHGVIRYVVVRVDQQRGAVHAHHFGIGDGAVLSG